eukprot:1147266-Prymnesium_polylepis.1
MLLGGAGLRAAVLEDHREGHQRELVQRPATLRRVACAILGRGIAPVAARPQQQHGIDLREPHAVPKGGVVARRL